MNMSGGRQTKQGVCFPFTCPHPLIQIDGAFVCGVRKKIIICRIFFHYIKLCSLKVYSYNVSGQICLNGLI